MTGLEIAVSIAAIVVCLIALLGPWIKTQRELADLNARYQALHSAVERIEKLLDKLKIYLR